MMTDYASDCNGHYSTCTDSYDLCRAYNTKNAASQRKARSPKEDAVVAEVPAQQILFFARLKKYLTIAKHARIETATD